MPTKLTNGRLSTDPVSGFRFYVEIDGVIKGCFSECGGLSIEREVYSYQEGGVNDHEHKLAGRIKQSTITFKRGIAGNELWDWFKQGLYDGKIKRQHISILLYNADHTKVRRWNLTDAFPTKWTGPDLNTEGNQVAFESIEIAHEGLETVDWAGAA